MAFHPSSHHGHGHHKPCCCCSCCCSSSCCQSTPHPAIHSATATAANDPLLQAIAARLFHPPTPAPPHHLYNQGYPVPQPHHPQHQQQQQYQKKQQRPHKYEQQQVHQPQAESLIESLLGRIAALESALPHLSPPPPPPAAMPDPPPRKPQPHPPANPRLSLRDLAARTIQAHFRLYLVRRSQALRHLKHLAAVRSRVVAIKSSLSDQARLNPEEAVSRRASDLLLQLDSIQNTDPTIREGKRSISRELAQLLELADGPSARRLGPFTEPKGIDPLPLPCPEQSSRGVEERAGVSAMYGEDGEESDAGIHNPPSKPGKRVNFTDRVNASRVYTSARSPFAAMNAEWGGGGDGRSGHASDEERSPSGRQNLWTIRPAANGSLMEHKGSSRLLGLSAPTPVQMEPRRGDPENKISAPV